jgi:hypothetical protein
MDRYSGWTSIWARFTGDSFVVKCHTMLHALELLKLLALRNAFRGEKSVSDGRDS